MLTWLLLAIAGLTFLGGGATGGISGIFQSLLSFLKPATGA